MRRFAIKSSRPNGRYVRSGSKRERKSRDGETVTALAQVIKCNAEKRKSAGSFISRINIAMA